MIPCDTASSLWLIAFQHHRVKLIGSQIAKALRTVASPAPKLATVPITRLCILGVLYFFYLNHTHYEFDVPRFAKKNPWCFVQHLN
jgi:hypothetical protein